MADEEDNRPMSVCRNAYLPSGCKFRHRCSAAHSLRELNSKSLEWTRLRRTLCCFDWIEPGSCPRVACIFMHAKDFVADPELTPYPCGWEQIRDARAMRGLAPRDQEHYMQTVATHQYHLACQCQWGSSNAPDVGPTKTPSIKTFFKTESFKSIRITESFSSAETDERDGGVGGGDETHDTLVLKSKISTRVVSASGLKFPDNIKPLGNHHSHCHAFTVSSTKRQNCPMPRKRRSSVVEDQSEALEQGALPNKRRSL